MMSKNHNAGWWKCISVTNNENQYKKKELSNVNALSSHFWTKKQKKTKTQPRTNKKRLKNDHFKHILLLTHLRLAWFWMLELYLSRCFYLCKWPQPLILHQYMQLPLCQGWHAKAQPLLTHRAITPLASLVRSATHDEHSLVEFGRSIRRCTISMQRINTQRWRVVHRHAKAHGVQTSLQITVCFSCFCFYFAMRHITLKHSRCQHYPGSKKRNYSCTAAKKKNFFITRWNTHTKNIECLWRCYRPWTASCQAACAIFLSCWQPFSCNASFSLVQPLTGRHPAAPVLDKVKTRVGVDWLVDPYLIKDSISLSLSVCRRGPASSCFLCLLNQNLPPLGKVVRQPVAG